MILITSNYKYDQIRSVCASLQAGDGVGESHVAFLVLHSSLRHQRDMILMD